MNVPTGFAKRVEQLRTSHRAYASYVRHEYHHIEASIQDGVPIEALCQLLNEVHGLNGSLAAFKSALQRIRAQRKAKAVLQLPSGFVSPSELDRPAWPQDPNQPSAQSYGHPPSQYPQPYPGVYQIPVGPPLENPRGGHGISPHMAPNLSKEYSL